MSKNRLTVVNKHIHGNASHCYSLTPCNGTEKNNVPTQNEAPSMPKRRQEVLKWNGWGYKDSKFKVNKDGQVEFTGERYKLSGQTMPILDHKTPAQPELTAKDIQAPIKNEDFIGDLRRTGISNTDDCQDRLFRAHGHTLHEVFLLREGKFKRIPDLVVWPNSHNEVVKIVELCCKHNVVLIPFGGGTSVSFALECPSEEQRMIVSLDTSQMVFVLN
ncbi:AGPS [Mytilus coruscus]|uniref:Alkylglycerone-phosphate synthase n=1 Tax=Mytilus coruscus TaxID=42192 RepID=A0A6J8AIS7_MYTCO|nr:AGPS [Mytilus coruscus]